MLLFLFRVHPTHYHTYRQHKDSRCLATTTSLTMHLGISRSAHRQDKLMRHSHVATKTFQALRIFVNNEMNELHNGLEIAHHLLRPDTGVCVAISFHSLEDRVVKRHFQGIDMDARCNMSIVDQNRSSAKFYGEDVIQRVMQRRWETVRRMVQPQPEDVEENPRARSAKLRAAVKLC